MAIPKTSGRDLRGNPIYLKTPQGEVVLDENLEPDEDDELKYVAPEFTRWINEGRI